MPYTRQIRPIATAALVVSSLVAAACGSDTTSPSNPPATLTLTTASVGALDSTAHVVEQANPGNADLKSLVDSTLLVFTAGVNANRIDLATDLTSVPLYFVGIHRVFALQTGSFSTWTVVGMDDPMHLANLIEVSGYAQASGGTAPSSVTGTIGDGLGLVNAQLMQVATGGAVTQFRASTGSASFSSSAAGAVCPGFTATATVTCALETMHVHFTASGTSGSVSHSATIPTDVDIPTMRLTYTP